VASCGCATHPNESGGPPRSVLILRAVRLWWGEFSDQECCRGDDGEGGEYAAHVGVPVADVGGSTDGDLQQFIGDAVECAENDQPPCPAPGETIAGEAVEDEQEVESEIGEEVERLVGDFFERDRDSGKMGAEEHQPPIDDEENTYVLPMSLKPIKHLNQLLVHGVS